MPEAKVPPDVLEFMITEMYWQTCDPKNPDNLVREVAAIKNAHKVVLGIATALGGVIAFVVNYFKIGNGGHM